MADSSRQRLHVNGAAMFLAGLVFALPPFYATFPGTRYMLTLHLEATQNALMLFAAAYLLQYARLPVALVRVVEVCLHVGAWCNVLPWLLLGYTGAVLDSSILPVTSTQITHTPPANNAELAQVAFAMLVVCATNVIAAWTLLLLGLARPRLAAATLKAKQH